MDAPDYYEKMGRGNREAGGMVAAGITGDLERLQIDRGGLALLGVALFFERNLLTVIQTRKAGPLDGRDVYEHVGAAIVRSDEAVTLGAIEPFDAAVRHEEVSDSEIAGRAHRPCIKMPINSECCSGHN